MAFVIAKCRFEATVAPLIGLPLSLAWKGYGSFIFLEIGCLHRSSNSRARHPNGQFSIELVEWRVEEQGRVKFGWASWPHEITGGLEQLVGLQILKCELCGSIPELHIELERGIVIRSFRTSEGNPDWRIRLGESDYVWSECGDVVRGEGAAVPLSAEEEWACDAASAAASRWTMSQSSEVSGRCQACRWFVPLAGESFLLDFGVCTSPLSSYDGRAIKKDAGCDHFCAT